MTYLPYTGAVTTHTDGDHVKVQVQLKETYELSPIQLKLRKGFAIDNHLYLHQTIDKASGAILEQYTGPTDL